MPSSRACLLGKALICVACAATLSLGLIANSGDKVMAYGSSANAVTEAAQADASYETITGTVTKIDSSDRMRPSFTLADLTEAGYEHGDVLLVTFGSSEPIKIPFLAHETDAGVYGTCLCDDDKNEGLLYFRTFCGAVEVRYGVSEGDTITISMFKKSDFLAKMEFSGLIDDAASRSDYATNQIYANFRVVQTTGIAYTVLYRSASPVNVDSNAQRASYADDFCEAAGIRTVLDLSDSDADILEYLADDDFDSPYYASLVADGNVYGADIAQDIYVKSNTQKLAGALRFMIDHDGPYLVHCKGGKDRTGLVCVLLESLCGADLSEVRADYMRTYTNTYGIAEGSQRYAYVQSITVDRLLYVLANPTVMDDFEDIDWYAFEPSDADLESIDLQQMATTYLQDQVGLSDDEISQLKSRLTEQAV